MSSDEYEVQYIYWSIMGAQNCCSAAATLQNVVEGIPDPTGQPIDPLHSKKEIIEAINFDPHIHYFKNQIENALMQKSKLKRVFRNKDELIFATTDKKEYDSYIEIINNSIKSNELSTTNVLTRFFKEVADLREREEVEAKFKNQKFAALKCFVYLYTGDYAYKMVNKSLRSKEYERLAPIIALVKKELTSFSQENSTLANRNIGLLYRGIPQPDPQMVQKSRLYWRGFTSTALNKEIAKKFGRYQYTIALKRGLPHEFLIIPKELSHYEEEEVLIFPYFFFEVAKVVTFQANKSENYEIFQMPPESDVEQPKESLQQTKQNTLAEKENSV